MSNDEPRENDKICLNEVLELACNMAHQDLISYWSNMQMCEAMEFEVNGESRYTDLAQEKFDIIYDDVEGRIVELMGRYPSLHIHEIEALLLHDRNKTERQEDEQ